MSETKKNIHILVPADLHKKFKMLALAHGETYREMLLRIMAEFVVKNKVHLAGEDK